MPPSALDLSTDHLRTLSELHAALRQDAVESDAASLNPLALSRENIRRTKRLLLDVQKLRRSPRTHAVHTRSHATRLAMEKVWEQHLLRLSSTLVGQMDLDSAITAAHKAWITPPEDPVSGVIAGNLGDLVIKFFKIRKARKLDKITDSAPTADDKAAIKAWGGQRGGMGGLAMMSNDPSHIRILRDEAGKPIAVASVGEEKGVLNIRILASAPDAPGAGRTMMQMLAKEAGGKNLGIALVSTNGSEGFYDRIGMTKTENIRHSWTPAQVQAFAATAGVLAPPGARNPGLSATENAGAQQLALNALQGVPEGQRGTAADVKAALTSTVNEDSWVTGGATNYIGLATQTAEQAGQVSLDHLGLHQTFEFANPQNMAQDTFGVRGSKVIQNMYGDHVDKLTQIITDATDPRNPKTISEVKASIREQWPALQKYQVERIARTETAAVWTTTAANAYAANGISSFETIVASGPSIGIESEDPCDECVEMAADTHSIDDDLPPWHPNCRCEAIPVLEDEDGTPWLPPDEPWTGGADGAAPVDGYVGRTAPSPGDQASQYVEADLQHLDPKLAVEDPIPAKYQKTIDQLGLSKALQTPDTVAASADFGTTGASPGSDAVYDKLVAPLRDDPAATQQANAAKTIGDNTTPPAPDELVLAPSWKMLDVSGKTYHADAGLTWAYEHNGIIVRIETGSADKGISFQQAQRYKEAINANLDSWSAAQVAKLKSVTYSQGTSPWDEEFARMAGMPHFLAAAQATKDSIYVWQGARYAGRQDIFDHEMGHVLGVNHGAPLPLVWQGARANDAAEGGRYLSYSGNWNGSGDSVSEYGSTNPREDWAESVRLYMADKRFGYIGEGVEKGVPGGAIKVRFADVWPNRAALINKWLFGPGPTNQTLIDSIDKQIEGFQARLAREMKLRGNAQAEANISVIEHKITQLQTTRLEAGGDTFSTQDAAILKAPHAYLDAAPEGAVITIPDAPGSTAYAGQWTKTADGWEQGTRKMQSAALDVVTAAALTIALPGPHLGLGIMADVVAWSIFAAQLQGYMGGVSLLGHPVLNTPSPEKAKRDALAARVGLAPPPPKPSAPRRRRSS